MTPSCLIIYTEQNISTTTKDSQAAAALVQCKDVKSTTETLHQCISCTSRRRGCLLVLVKCPVPPQEKCRVRRSSEGKGRGGGHCRTGLFSASRNGAQQAAEHCTAGTLMMLLCKGHDNRTQCCLSCRPRAG